MENTGLVLTCDISGRVLSVEINNTGFENDRFVDRLLIDIFSNEDISKVLEFFVETKSVGASFSKQLSVISGEKTAKFFFSSVKIDNKIIILGTNHRANFDDMMSQMMSINNDQTNMLRQLFKAQLAPEDKKERVIETVLYEELSRVNNDLVNIQRELAKKNHELEALNKLKNQFLGMAAHDLRNPLGVIMNLSEFILEEKEKLSEEAVSFLEKIDSLSRFMLNMVTELLDISSIESGQMNLNKTRFDLVQLVRDSVNLNKSLAEKKNIFINFISSEQSLQLYADLNKIDQVITNLLTNAVKYSNQNTTTVVAIMRDLNKARLVVKDQGQGIPSNEIVKLFKPFAKTSVKSTGGEKSTGLGLMIVKKIVEGHGGTISVESEVGTGSTFTVELPLAEE